MNEQILTTVEAALRRAGVLHSGATLLVALSGGADSVALLHAVRALGQRHGFVTRAAHVEHGLRGEPSVADARFCEALCQTLGVPFTLRFANLSGGMDAFGAEARAREARYRLLFASARQCGADALLLAHHRDDQAETVLAHLIRGSGARGLGGMREVSRHNGVLLVRPLLALSKAELLAALDGAPCREDETNAQPLCQRNRIRAQVLPLLLAENPRAAEHIAQSARLLAMDEDCLATQAEGSLALALADEPPLLYVRKAPLLAAPDAVAVRALRRFAMLGVARLMQAQPAPENEPAPCIEPAPDAECSGFGLQGEQTLSMEDSLALLALLHAPAGGTLNLPHGLRAEATARHVHLVRMADGSPVTDSPAVPPAPLSGAPQSLRFGRLVFSLAPFAPGQSPPPDGVRCVAVPNALLQRAVLRTPQTGDRIRPFGASGGKPLRRYLTDRKLDAPFRPNLPLLCVGGDVLWAVGVGAAEGTRLGEQPATLVTVAGAMDW